MCLNYFTYIPVFIDNRYDFMELIMLDQSALSNILTTFGPLFAIANPFGAVPIFLDLLRAPQIDKYCTDAAYQDALQKYKKNQRKQALFIGFTVFSVLILSLLAGEGIFNFFGINFGVLRIAGGLLIFKLGWKMASVSDSLLDSETQSLVGSEEESSENCEDELQNRKYQQNVIVPIAIPLISGPGAISVVISQAHAASQWTAYLDSSIAIFLLSLLVSLCLYSSGKISKRLGKTGIEVLERIFGFIVLAIALEMLSHGIFGVVEYYGPQLTELFS